MEVRPGYKQTEVGVIPEDWEVSSLEDCCKKITDGTHDTPRPVKSGVPFLTAIHVKDNHIAYEECLFVTKADHEIIFKRCNPEKGDVLMVNIGAGVATTALVEVEYEFSLKNVALLKPDSGRISGPYLNYCLAKKKESITQALLSGGAQPFLSLMQIGQIKIPTPRKEEQRAIAVALGYVDALIDGLERLIAKKRDLKQAAMQQLLTGQTRLPGFSGQWELKRLGELGSFSKGKGIRKDDVVPEGLPCVRYGEIYTHHTDVIRNFFSFIPPEVAKGSQRLRKGDLLFAGSGETAEEIGKCVAFLVDVEAYAGGDIVILSPVGQNSMYLGYLMNHASVVKQKSRMGQGDAVVHISSRHLAEVNMRLPQQAEQAAIATVLSDMDAEIMALEQRLAKTRALKQGMMQELLTGRTRLTVS